MSIKFETRKEPKAETIRFVNDCERWRYAERPDVRAEDGGDLFQSDAFYTFLRDAWGSGWAVERYPATAWAAQKEAEALGVDVEEVRDDDLALPITLGSHKRHAIVAFRRSRTDGIHAIEVRYTR